MCYASDRIPPNADRLVQKTPVFPRRGFLFERRRQAVTTAHRRICTECSAAHPEEPRIPDAVLDQLLAGADPQAVFDPNGLLDALKKALAERVLNAAMDHHLASEEPGNRRNGYGKKTVITDTGQIELKVPRDRQARFAGRSRS
jgi:hypothetical protein